MPRWTKKIENSVKLAGKEQDRSDFLNAFFESEVYIPHNEVEEKEFEEFSLVLNSMALLIYVAKANKIIEPEVKQQIIEDLTFQLHQRPPREYQKLKSEFGTYEKEIISNIFDKIVKEYEEGKIDINKTIQAINLVYKHNLEKRYYLLRLCYYCAYSDNYLDKEEANRIAEIAQKLKVGDDIRQAVEEEVIDELHAKMR
jgi:tellurite resistance protein